ncbi:MAG: rhamnulokinase family protein [Oscillospiraceae bacterium]
MAKTVLVFDFGISNARVMLCRFDGSALSLEEIHRFANVPVMEDGQLRWDIDELYEQLKIGISFGVFNGGFDAISTDAWGVDFGLIDKSGQLIEKPVHYADEIPQGVMEEVFRRIPAQELFGQSGVLPQSINTLFRLAALSMNGGNTLFRAEKMLMIPDLFAYFLTGEYRSEYTTATTTQLIEHRSRGWNIRLIEALGLPKRIFSPIIRPGEVYGELKYELAEEFRCEQVPVIACAAHDTASTALAVPSHEEQFAFISCGTWIRVGAQLVRPVITEQVMEAGFTNEGGSGDCSLLMKNMTGLRLIRECRRYYSDRGGDQSFSDLEREAAAAERFGSFIDPDDPSFYAAEDMPLRIAEYCRRTGQAVPESVGEVMCCIYRSLACGIAAALEELERLTGCTYDTVYLTGGGARDALLCGMTASAAGRRVVAGPSEAAALGNGIASLIALGEIKDAAQARRIIIESGLTKEYLPADPEKWSAELSRYKNFIGKNGG